MQYLTIDYIKKHSRIDFDYENEAIAQYGEASERAILNLLGRSYDDLIATYGEVPTPVIQATFELVDNLIQHRSPIEQVSMSVVPYSFDLMLKPYMIL